MSGKEGKISILEKRANEIFRGVAEHYISTHEPKAADDEGKSEDIYVTMSVILASTMKNPAEYILSLRGQEADKVMEIAMQTTLGADPIVNFLKEDAAHFGKSPDFVDKLLLMKDFVVGMKDPSADRRDQFKPSPIQVPYYLKLRNDKITIKEPDLYDENIINEVDPLVWAARNEAKNVTIRRLEEKTAAIEAENAINATLGKEKSGKKEASRSTALPKEIPIKAKAGVASAPRVVADAIATAARRIVNGVRGSSSPQAEGTHTVHRRSTAKVSRALLSEEIGDDSRERGSSTASSITYPDEPVSYPSNYLPKNHSALSASISSVTAGSESPRGEREITGATSIKSKQVAERIEEALHEAKDNSFGGTNPMHETSKPSKTPTKMGPHPKSRSH